MLEFSAQPESSKVLGICSSATRRAARVPKKKVYNLDKQTVRH